MVATRLKSDSWTCVMIWRNLDFTYNVYMKQRQKQRVLMFKALDLVGVGFCALGTALILLGFVTSGWLLVFGVPLGVVGAIMVVDAAWHEDEWKVKSKN